MAARDYDTHFPPRNYEGPFQHITSAQDFTGSWADLGSEIDCRGVKRIFLYLTLDANNSQDMRIRGLRKYAAAGAGTEHDDQIKTVSSSDIKLEPVYYEFNNNLDQFPVLPIDLDYGVLYLQLQISAGTVGVTAGQVDDCWYIVTTK